MPTCTDNWAVYKLKTVRSDKNYQLNNNNLETTSRKLLPTSRKLLPTSRKLVNWPDWQVLQLQRIKLS
jgi:hypothetical protein